MNLPGTCSNSLHFPAPASSTPNSSSCPENPRVGASTQLGPDTKPSGVNNSYHSPYLVHTLSARADSGRREAGQLVLLSASCQWDHREFLAQRSPVLLKSLNPSPSQTRAPGSVHEHLTNLSSQPCLHEQKGLVL